MALEQAISGVEGLESAFGALSQVIPFVSLNEFETTLNELNVTCRVTANEFSRVKREIDALNNSTNLSKQEAAGLFREYTAGVNRMTLSIEKYRSLATAVAKVDPTNADRNVGKITANINALGRHAKALEEYGRTGIKTAQSTRALEFAYSRLGKESGDLLSKIGAQNRGLQNSSALVKQAGNAYKDASISMSALVYENKAFQAVLTSFAKPGVREVLLGLGAVKAAQTFGPKIGGFLGMRGTPPPGGVPPGGGPGMGGYFDGQSPAKALWVRFTKIAPGTPPPTPPGAPGGAPVPPGFLAKVGSGLGKLVGFAGYIGLIYLAVTSIYEYFKGEKKETERPDLIGDEEPGKQYEALQNILNEAENISAEFGDLTTTVGRQRGMAESQVALLSQLADQGLIGPQMVVSATLDVAKSIEDQRREQKAFYEAAAKEKPELAKSILEAGKIKDNALVGSLVSAIQGARRSMMEQLMGGAMNAPTGTFMAPGGQSERQLYGGSYTDNMSLANIRDRPQQQSFTQTMASYRPLEEQVLRAGGIPGRASGGIIPGAPSAKDNTLAHVATGEFVVNANATQKNRALLEKINSGMLPSFADGGLVTTSSGDETTKAFQRKHGLQPTGKLDAETKMMISQLRADKAPLLKAPGPNSRASYEASLRKDGAEKLAEQNLSDQLQTKKLLHMLRTPLGGEKYRRDESKIDRELSKDKLKELGSKTLGNLTNPQIDPNGPFANDRNVKSLQGDQKLFSSKTAGRSYGSRLGELGGALWEEGKNLFPSPEKLKELKAKGILYAGINMAKAATGKTNRSEASLGFNTLKDIIGDELGGMGSRLGAASKGLGTATVNALQDSVAGQSPGDSALGKFIADIVPVTKDIMAWRMPDRASFRGDKGGRRGGRRGNLAKGLSSVGTPAPTEVPRPLPQMRPPPPQKDYGINPLTGDKYFSSHVFSKTPMPIRPAAMISNASPYAPDPFLYKPGKDALSRERRANLTPGRDLADANYKADYERNQSVMAAGRLRGIPTNPAEKRNELAALTPGKLMQLKAPGFMPGTFASMGDAKSKVQTPDINALTKALSAPSVPSLITGESMLNSQDKKGGLRSVGLQGSTGLKSTGGGLQAGGGLSTGGLNGNPSMIGPQSAVATSPIGMLQTGGGSGTSGSDADKIIAALERGFTGLGSAIQNGIANTTTSI